MSAISDRAVNMLGEALSSIDLAKELIAQLNLLQNLSQAQLDSLKSGLVQQQADSGTASGTGVAVTEYGVGNHHTTVLTITNLALAITDTGGVNGGQGSQLVYTFPAGVIQLLGASYNLTTARVGTNLAANAAVVGSLGSVAADNTNSTLTSTEADMIASTTGTLTAGAGTLAKHGSLVATAFDGHTTAITAYLNAAVPDAGIAGNDTLTINGTITLNWVNLGDY